MIAYRGMSLDEVSVFIKERCLALSLKLYKDDDCILTQQIKSSDIRYGEYNMVKLNEPVHIEAGYSYKVTFLVMHEAGMHPIGMDTSASVDGKGNIISMDGKEWYPANYEGIDGNFNISIHLSPSNGSTDLIPAGYNVYRNGAKINSSVVKERTFSDEVRQGGIYAYQVSTLYENGGESGLSDIAEAEIIEIGMPHAPSLLKADVELNRTIRLRWNFPLATES